MNKEKEKQKLKIFIQQQVLEREEQVNNPNYFNVDTLMLQTFAEVRKKIKDAFEMGEYYFEMEYTTWYTGRYVEDLFRNVVDLCIDNEIDKRAHFIESAYQAAVGFDQARGHFYGETNPTLIFNVEQFYSVAFPKDYKIFLKKLHKTTLYEAYIGA